jgi:hypothetical protein
MRRAARLVLFALFALFALVALVVPFVACGGLLAPPDETRPSDAAVPVAPGPTPPDAVAPSPPLPVPDASGFPSPPPLMPFDAGASPCVAAGGTCLELIPCDGELVDLACGWSAACCMPPGYDAGRCPLSIPAPGTPCDVPLTCAYPACIVTFCSDGGWSAGAACSPPPPGH